MHLSANGHFVPPSCGSNGQSFITSVLSATVDSSSTPKLGDGFDFGSESNAISGFFDFLN